MSISNNTNTNILIQKKWKYPPGNRNNLDKLISIVAKHFRQLVIYEMIDPNQMLNKWKEMKEKRENSIPYIDENPIRNCNMK